jgi:hypothetical protein
MQRELVELATWGDHDAFEALVAVAFDGLYALAHRILRDIDRTDDAVDDSIVVEPTASGHPPFIRLLEGRDSG